MKVLKDLKPSEHALTMRHLRLFVQGTQDLPDDTNVLLERIEDIYFEKNGWKTLDVEFEEMGGPQRFFHGHCIMRRKTEEGEFVLIHAHY